MLIEEIVNRRKITTERFALILISYSLNINSTNFINLQFLSSIEFSASSGFLIYYNFYSVYKKYTQKEYLNKKKAFALIDEFTKSTIYKDNILLKEILLCAVSEMLMSENLILNYKNIINDYLIISGYLLSHKKIKSFVNAIIEKVYNSLIKKNNG